MGFSLGGQRNGLQLNPFGGGDISYLLLDRFNDTLAAGAVNGTSPTPGPGGPRTVTDTNGKLSVTGSVASFATGGAGLGDPSLWYASQARVIGKTVIGRIVISTTVGGILGWDANQLAGVNDAIRFSASSVLVIVFNGNTVTVGAYTTTTYDCAVVMRAIGMYMLIKGGAFTNWTLLWQSGVTNSAMFPTVQVVSAVSPFDIDNIRIPTPIFVPTPLAYDTFTRADGALGNSEIVGPDGQAVAARAWTVQAGTIAIVSNAASLTLAGGGLNAIATLDGVSSDVLVYSNITRTLGSGGMVFRYADANNYLRANHDGTNCLFEQVVAGTPTTLRTGVVAYSAGAPLLVILSGTTGWLFYNNAPVGASFTVPASSATLHGLYGTDLSCLWDNFQALARGVGNEYAALNAL